MTIIKNAEGCLHSVDNPSVLENFLKNGWVIVEDEAPKPKPAKKTTKKE